MPTLFSDLVLATFLDLEEAAGQQPTHVGIEEGVMHDLARVDVLAKETLGQAFLDMRGVGLPQRVTGTFSGEVV